MKNEMAFHSALRMLAFTGMTTFAVGTAWCQASAPLALPDLPASGSAAAPPAASRTAPGPRLRSPAETGNRATAPGDLRPERSVTPQISMPLGRKQAASEGETRPLRRQAAPAAGGIDDGVARCEAEPDEAARATCRARLARESRVRKTN